MIFNRINSSIIKTTNFLLNNNSNNKNVIKNFKIFYSSGINSTLPSSLSNNINNFKNNNNDLFKTFDIEKIKKEYENNNESGIIEYYESFIDDFAKKETRLMNWDSSHWASFKGHKEYIKLLLADGKQQKPDKFGVTSLQIAIQRGFFDSAILIAESGLVDPNQRDTKPGIRLSPLHLSLNHSNPSIYLIRLLLKKGANVNQESTDKRTPLFRACQLSREDIIQLLLEYGANINIQDNPKTNGWEYYRVSTPLHISVSKGDYNIVKLLLEKGGNANLRLMDDCGESLLHVAALNGDIEMSKLLIENGADFNALDCYEATPLDYAQSGYQSNLEYVEFLKSNYKNIKNGKGRKM
ncbi:hypothetical protein ACTFIY_000428 [Dictyostelium cf. discoideum]